ncbi:MAG: hypothetical protein KGK01_18590 [Bradyrhizobium sp.]|uniref:hypothetical protein n=1 Tax=Bradyrhizobium sp. TaxID=376 RepID=UPI001C29CA64|nr:hypothetical protein [Bradyrhizobium sp.]MBU6462047.1 hypothetical protein [Pseudomonadota bacterium]MDE2066456.1 hypothetical protein [Bradyrhizobium sp.]MDE2244354.1 hypothetical protein [Bradyrhizobium sp.]MDE2467287.1 hypothetical protein [Bradyrhizobium sp.]
MKRFYALAGLMLLGSPACAGDSFSFVIGGHRIHIEAPRHCGSASCVSISIRGVYEQRSRCNRGDDADDLSPAPVVAPVASPAPPSPVQPIAHVAPATPPHVVASVALLPPQSQPQPIQSPPIQPITTATVAPPPMTPGVIARPSAVVPAAAALPSVPGAGI